MLKHAELVADWHWPDFTHWEMRSNRDEAFHTDFLCMVDPDAMDKLQALRTLLGFPFIITSAHRTPEYNATHSKTGGTGPHTTGRAFDIQVYGYRAFQLDAAAKANGYTGIGWSQKGPHEKRFIHIDDLEQRLGCPRPWVWSY